MVVSVSSATRRSAMAPISAMASAIMSAANATGSAWKLPPDRTSRCSANSSGLSLTALASIIRVARGGGEKVAGGTHDLGLAAEGIGILHLVVADEMRGADRAPGEEPAIGGSEAHLAGMRPQRVNARVERCVGALDGVGRQRSGDHRRMHHPLGADQGGKRDGGRDLGAVQERQPLFRPKLHRRDAGPRQRRRRRSCACRRPAPRPRRSPPATDGRAARGRRRPQPSPATG